MRRPYAILLFHSLCAHISRQFNRRLSLLIRAIKEVTIVHLSKHGILYLLRVVLLDQSPFFRALVGRGSFVAGRPLPRLLLDLLLRLLHLLNLLLELLLHLAHLALHLHHFFPLLMAGLLQKLSLRLDLGELAGLRLPPRMLWLGISHVTLSHGLVGLIVLRGWMLLLIVVGVALVVEVGLLLLVRVCVILLLVLRVVHPRLLLRLVGLR